MIESSKAKTKPDKTADSKTGQNKPEQSYKFENYFDKKIPQKYIKPHQVCYSLHFIDSKLVHLCNGFETKQIKEWNIIV